MNPPLLEEREMDEEGRTTAQKFFLFLLSRVFLFPVISRTTSAVKSTTNAEIYAAGPCTRRKEIRERRP